MAYSEKPTYDELLERLTKVEAALKGGVDIRDLPMRQIQDRLELDWQPDAGLLLGSDLPRGGKTDVTIVASAGTATIGHGLARLPTAVVACVTLGGALANGGDVEVVTGNETEDTFDVFVQFFGGVFAGIARVAWIAI
jgi:hypothetical protein